MKAQIKKLLPGSIKKWRMVYFTFGADVRRYNKALKFEEDRRNSEIIMVLHIIEKGLTMPSPRLGFGEKRVIYLCELLKKYAQKGFNTQSFEFLYAIKVLNEYLVFHERREFVLNKEIRDSIEEVQKRFNFYDNSNQLEFTKEDFFSKIKSDFQIFSGSRYTVRNYTTEILPIEEIRSAVKLAQNAPSSCNRQPVRVWIVSNRELIEKSLDLQGGSRGFGQLTSVLLIITTNVSYFADINERTQASLNSGFFGMSLLYALHYKKIGAATLNWSHDERNDTRLRKLIKIPDNEQINFMISCGYVPEKFSVAASVRRDVDSIIRIVE